MKIKNIKTGFSCNMKWSAMHGTGSSRHCESCNKSVYNISELTDGEKLDFLNTLREDKICVKSSISELRRLKKKLKETQNSSYVKQWLLAASITGVMACGTTEQTFDESHALNLSKYEILEELYVSKTKSVVSILGQVVDEANKPMIGANIYLSHGKRGCTTDLEGQFSLEVLEEDELIDTVMVSYTGYRPIYIPIDEIRDKKIKVDLAIDEGVYIGEIVVIERPWYTRLWNRIIKRKK